MNLTSYKSNYQKPILAKQDDLDYTQEFYKKKSNKDIIDPASNLAFKTIQFKQKSIPRKRKIHHIQVDSNRLEPCRVKYFFQMIVELLFKVIRRYPKRF